MLPCPGCGFQEEDGSTFCSNCGASFPGPSQGGQYQQYQQSPQPLQPHPSQASHPQAYTVPPQPPPADAGAYQQAPPPATHIPYQQGHQPQADMAQYTQAPHPSQPGDARNKWMPWLIGSMGLLVVAVVVLVLVLTVFKGDGDGSTIVSDDGPLGVVGAFYTALEGEDAAALLGLLDPDFIDEMKEEHGADYKVVIGEFFSDLLPVGAGFSDLEFEPLGDGDEVSVHVTAGTVTFPDEPAQKAASELAKSGADVLHLMRVDGVWYIDVPLSFPAWESYIAKVGQDDPRDGGREAGRDLITYEGMLVPVELRHPLSWTAEEYPDGFLALWPKDDEDTAAIYIWCEDLTEYEYGLEDWMVQVTADLDLAGWQYKMSSTKVDGNPAARAEYSETDTAPIFKVMQTYVMKNGMAYSVKFLCEETAYERYLKDAMKVIDSLKLLG